MFNSSTTSNYHVLINDYAVGRTTDNIVFYQKLCIKSELGDILNCNIKVITYNNIPLKA